MWNCQGVGGPLDNSQLKETINLHSPDLIILSETKNRSSVMEKIKRKIGFDQVAVVEAAGKSGGMAVYWKEEGLIKKVETTTFTMEVLVEEAADKTRWWCIGIYASTDSRIKRQQWAVIKRRKRLWGDNWILIGDFNDIASNVEKWGGREREEWTFKDFKELIRDNLLIGIGFTGDPRGRLNKDWTEG